MRSLLAYVSLFAIATAGLGCGRSELEVGLGASTEDADAADSGPSDGDTGPRPDAGDGGRRDASDGGPDSGRDGGPDSGRDGGPDSGRDGGRDGGPDGGRDGGPDLGPTCDQDCSFLDGLCVVGFCDPNVGACVARPLPTGTRCDDGDPCTLGDVCARGQCVGRPLDCSAFNTQCTVGACDAINPGQCLALPIPDGVPCDDGVQCTVNDLCIQGACNAGTPVGGCNSPVPIPLFVGTQVVVAPTGCVGAQDIRNTCGRRSGPDAVWSLTSDGPRILQVVAPAPGRNSSLALATQCGFPPSELQCVQPAGNLSAETLVSAGDTFVVVDPGGALFPGGVAQLQVTIDPHDTCAGAIAFDAPPVGVTVQAPGTTVGSSDDFQGPCAGASQSPDHVYQVTVNQPSLIEFRLDVPPNGNFFDSAMYLFPGPCVSGPVMALACDDDSNGSLQPRFETTLQPGVYFLVVDGFGVGQQGEYALRVTTRPTQATFVFPEVGDARLQQVPGVFSQDGDFVEGARRPPLMSISSAIIELTIANALLCDTIDLAISINGIVVGLTNVFPGMGITSLNLFFPPIAGPNYSIRYEILRDVAPGCGGIDLPLGISTITVGP